MRCNKVTPIKKTATGCLFASLRPTLSGLYRRSAFYFGNHVFLVDKHQLGAVAGQLAIFVGGKAGDDQQVAGAARRAAEPFTEMVPEPRSARMA